MKFYSKEKKKDRNLKIIKENEDFLKAASEFDDDDDIELPKKFMPKKKINESKRESVIDAVFKEDKASFIEEFMPPPPKTDKETQKTLSAVFNDPSLTVFEEKTSDSLLQRLLPFLDRNISSFIHRKLTAVFQYIDEKIQKLYEEVSVSKTGKNMIPMGGIFIDRTTGSLSSSGTPGGSVPADIAILNDGVQLDLKAKSLNFIGVGVKVYTDGNGNINIFIPPTLLSSFFNSGAATVTPETTVLRNVSFPTTEGTPFVRGSFSGKFQCSRDSILSFTTVNPFSTSGTDTVLTVTVKDLYGTVIASLSQTVPGDVNTGFISGIRIITNGFINEGNKYSMTASFDIDLNILLGGSSGGIQIELQHDNKADGIYTFTQSLFFDSEALIGSISSVTFSQAVPVIKYLSGIAYYGIGSTFNITANGIDNCNSDSYPDLQLRMSSPNLGIAQNDYNGSTDFSGFSTLWNAVGMSISKIATIAQTSYRYRGNNGKAQAALIDWTVGSAVQSIPQSVLIDTYGNSSSQYTRAFDDELFRLESDYLTAWDSSAHLGAGEAMVFDGFLMHPTSGYLIGDSSAPNSNWIGYLPNPMSQPDYSALISIPVSYYTKITDSATDKNSFQIRFNGQFVGGNALADLLAEKLKIFIRRVGGNGNIGTAVPPLAVHGGFYSFSTFDDGATLLGSRILEGSSVGNIINCTFGGLSCKNGIYLEIQLNDTALKINDFTVEFF